MIDTEEKWKKKKDLTIPVDTSECNVTFSLVEKIIRNEKVLVIYSWNLEIALSNTLCIIRAYVGIFINSIQVGWWRPIYYHKRYV